MVNRAARSDVTYAFLAFYLAILFGRALWLGQPLAIPLHQLGSGGFLIFTFFMISDPRTTPDSRAGRILFALLVALGAGTRPLRPLPAQRPAAGALLPRARRPADRPAAARRAVRLAAA